MCGGGLSARLKRAGAAHGRPGFCLGRMAVWKGAQTVAVVSGQATVRCLPGALQSARAVQDDGLAARVQGAVGLQLLQYAPGHLA